MIFKFEIKGEEVSRDGLKIPFEANINAYKKIIGSGQKIA